MSCIAQAALLFRDGKLVAERGGVARGAEVAPGGAGKPDLHVGGTSSGRVDRPPFCTRQLIITDLPCSSCSSTLRQAWPTPSPAPPSPAMKRPLACGAAALLLCSFLVRTSAEHAATLPNKPLCSQVFAIRRQTHACRRVRALTPPKSALAGVWGQRSRGRAARTRQVRTPPLSTHSTRAPT